MKKTGCATVRIKIKGDIDMAISLAKGGKISLAKAAADAGINETLKTLRCGLGWDCNQFDGGSQFDLDATVFICGEDGKALPGELGICFYNNKVVAGIEHKGDNLTGEGDGDDETIMVDLTNLPAGAVKLAFTVTINDADIRRQNFGMVNNSYIRIVDEASGTELIHYDLGEDFSVETALVVAELYNHNGEWKFNAVGSGYAGGLAALCNNYGVVV